jgi:4-hydroxybenzoate polyprenyltransferase
LGSFFTYEVSRKLDPKAHPVLGTYLTVYGKFGSLAIVCGLFPLCLVSGINVMLPFWTVPWAVLTLLSYGLLWLQTSEKPGKYHKVVEGFATLSLFFYIWSPALFNLYAKLVEL